MPRRRQVEMMRQAISPRLAMRTLLNTCLPHPGGLAAREEGCDALACLGAGANTGETAGALLELLERAGRERAQLPQQPLAVLLRARRPLAQRREQPLHALLERLGLHHIVYQPELLHLGCAAALAE